MIDSFKNSLPGILWRYRWNSYCKQFGVPFTRGTMQNRDSAGDGPKAHKLGNRTYYLKEDYIDWLENLLASQVGSTSIE